MEFDSIECGIGLSFFERTKQNHPNKHALGKNQNSNLNDEELYFLENP